MNASLIALDWGTSSLRAFLLGARGEHLDARTEPWGVMQVPDGDFDAAFDAVTGAWRSRDPHLRAVACGMVGSNQGWVEAPYCPVPAGAADLAARLVAHRGGAVHVIPGVARFDGRPDVMRGEETQIVGALALHPELAAESRFVLPGTHSKWVDVRDGRIVDLTTYMTGELFAVLRQHSILGRPLRPAASGVTASPQRAFSQGVAAGRDAVGGLAPLLFSARAMVLADRLAAGDSADYLSGLLLGDEIRAGLAGGSRSIVLVGEPALCQRYAEALELFDVTDPLIIRDSARAGLWRIARLAGLVVPSEASS